MIVTGLVVLLVGLGSTVLGFMIWALALNGFMGQQRAIDISMVTFVALAVLSVLVTMVLSVLVVYFLSAKRAWNAAISALISIVVFAGTTGVLHMVSVIISAIVADQLRTNR